MVNADKSKKERPEKGLPVIVSPYLMKLIGRTGGKNGPIGRQFLIPSSLDGEKTGHSRGRDDPFDEAGDEVAPGLVYKYRGAVRQGKVIRHGRALWTVSRFCASYCRFCFRGRVVGLPADKKRDDGTALGKAPYLSRDQMREVFQYIKKHPELNEIIVSGGDPLVTPERYLGEIICGLAALQKKGSLDVIRIGTRLPVQDPEKIEDWHIKLLAEIKNPYIMVHINHPAEITQIMLDVLYRLRRECLATVMSQTVLLKGVNDDPEILQALFEKLAKEGVRPYYLFQNDPVPWARDFTVPFERAQKIWSALRKKLSGIAATVKFTVESEGGTGKIPVPEGDFWNVDYSSYRDFEGRERRLATGSRGHSRGRAARVSRFAGRARPSV